MRVMAEQPQIDGNEKLAASIAQGQYDFPQGLFFGGSKPSKSYEVLQKELKNWIGDVDRIMLLDFHTGLGKHGTCLLYTSPSPRDRG